MSSAAQIELCQRCDQHAIISRPFSGEVLCKSHFQQSVETKVQQAISQWKMLRRTDRIAVAYSGGKDSTVLLTILTKIQERFPESEVVAITLDEGVAKAQNRRHIIDLATQLLGVELVTSSYQELYSTTLDEIAERARQANSPLSPCAYCGILRRQGLNILARKINADKLALGHNLDDDVQSMMMNFIRGDVKRLERSNPVLEGIPGWLVPRIKPLYHIPENELALYAQQLTIPYYRCPCTYGDQSLRTEIRKWLNSFEEQHAGTKYNLSATITKIIKTRQPEKPTAFEKCQKCGEPTSRNICGPCGYLTRLGIKQN